MNDCIRRNVPLLLVSLIAAGALIGSALILKLTELTEFWRIAAALMPLPFYIVMFVVAIRFTRKLDELKQRIQLEALAYATIGMLLSTITYGMLLNADVGMLAIGWEGVWVITVVFYIAGNLIAWRRYR